MFLESAAAASLTLFRHLLVSESEPAKSHLSTYTKKLNIPSSKYNDLRHSNLCFATNSAKLEELACVKSVFPSMFVNQFNTGKSHFYLFTM